MLRSALVFCLLAFCGCNPEAADPDVSNAPPPIPVAADEPGREPSVDELMRQLGVGREGSAQKIGGRIRIVDLINSRAKDLSPLKGLELWELYLENTQVTDLSPLAGMPLRKLHLNTTPVTELLPLAGMALTELNLNGCPIEVLDGLAGVKIDTLWIPKTKVTDLTPLVATELISLDFEETPVESLEPLKTMTTLRRLNLANSAVTDLTPLAGLKLDRLVFTPAKITTGLDAVREMKSLTLIGKTLPEAMPAAEFWQKLDAGDL